MGSETIEWIKHASGARAAIYLFGATVLSFFTAKEPGRDVLFVSKKAKLDASDQIYGGIPIVFPVFCQAPDNPAFPFHGFARISKEWKIASLEEGEGNVPTIAKLTLTSNDYTRSLWPHEFDLVYEVKLFAEKLITSLYVHNTNNYTISFQALFHTYYSVPEVREEGCIVEGLQSLSYFDKVAQKDKIMDSNQLVIDRNIDSIYKNTPRTFVIKMKALYGGGYRTVEIEKQGYLQDQNGTKIPQITDTVIWNPWIEVAQVLGDFEDEEYTKMVCVEPGRVSQHQTLEPGQIYILEQTIKA
jgi:glucose-6-phosphate 1-epimerase